MLLYGRTIYGGPFNPRQVTAEGSVVCAASASARANVAYRAASGSFATATVARGSALRTVLPGAVAITGRATVQNAKPKVDFRLAGVAQAVANVTGRAHAEFFLAGDLSAAALPSGRIIRTTRVRIPSQALGSASIEVEAALYALANPGRALCYANPFGTYWYVGCGEVSATAGASAQGERIRAAAGQAVGQADAAGQACVEFSGAAVVHAEATPDPDSMELRGGVRYWTGRARPVATSEATADAYVFSVALAVGRATVAGSCNARRAGAAAVRPTAQATGRAETVLPEYGTVRIDTAAAGEAVAQLAAFAKAQVAAAGASQATGRLAASAKGRAECKAEAQATVVWITAAGSAQAGAGATGRCERTSLGGGAAQVVSISAARARKEAAARVQVGGLAQLAGNGGLHPKVLASAAVVATATLVGSNNVNSALQRLSVRRVRVPAQARKVRVAGEKRQIVVAGQKRRVAA